MIKTKSEKNNIQKNSTKKNVCDLKYLTETMSGKKHLIKEIIEVFLKQVPEELHSLNEAIKRTDYKSIKNFAHTMKSSVSIMGISVLEPILKGIEDLGATGSGIERIIELNKELVSICNKAIKEIESEKIKYT